MNINLTDIELTMLHNAIDAVWWRQSATDEHGQSDANRAKRIQRKLLRAASHADTVIE
jgi:hypothetical protein|tara:strand:- start:1773 stop:1946 length:174 start_codon:yes stop_codon:yes gene_type:complete